MIKINDFSKSFTIHHLGQTREAINGISFDVSKGEFLGIVGESGSGKSTILKSVYGTYKPTSGTIMYDSEAFGNIDLHNISDRALIKLRTQEIGYVSQFLKVMPRTTTLELVINSMLEMGIDKEAATVRAEETLKHFDIPEALWHNYPNTFSGGEKLRLNIACAIVKNPRLLLLDEPTASLDEKSKLKVRETISKLIDNGTTLISIFHDLEFMDGLCNKVYDMNTKTLKELVI